MKRCHNLFDKLRHRTGLRWLKLDNMRYTIGTAIAVLAFSVSLVVSQHVKSDIPGEKDREWFPGDILPSTEHSDIEQALKDVADAGSIIETRSVALGISCSSGRLENPTWKMLDGNAHSTMPPEIEEGETGLLLFTKAPIGIKGVYGVLTYDIPDSEFKIAVMFNSPFNQISYSNTYNFKVFSKTTPVDRDMARHMYEFSGAWIARGYEERTEYGVHMYGTMSSNTHSRLIMWVDTSALDIRQGPFRYAECEHRLLIGDRCWRECTPTGWCWTAVKCSDNSDCDGATLLCNLTCEKP